MKKMNNKTTRSTIILLLSAALFVAAAIYLGGCTKTIDGETYANKAPRVYFANIPPSGATFSRNPEVYWYGSDQDGLIVMYRYYIATVAEMGGQTPTDFQATIADSAWTYVDVNPAEADPKTKHSIPLTADTTSPVLSFVDQWVFLQAFDHEGMGSEIVSRRFSRNDNPPTTGILDYSSALPFVNAEQAGGVVTGIRLTWQGADQIDYPTDPPPFQFQWRLYGPYTQAELADIKANYFLQVFQTNDGFIYRPGDTLFTCPDDTCAYYVIGEADSIPSFLGSFEDYFAIDDPTFEASTYNHWALQSCADKGCTHPEDACCEDTWVYNTSDTLYDVFRDYTGDNTITRNFIFWIRSRDDALVPDPTPAFSSKFGDISVIEPKYERDVLVIDYASSSLTSTVGHRLVDSSKAFWYDALRYWNPNVLFDTTKVGFDFADYVFSRTGFPNGVPIDTLLQYKVLILYNDAIADAGLTSYKADPVWKAIDAGVNVWMTSRAPIFGGLGEQENPAVPGLGPTSDYTKFFRVERMVYSGWFVHAFTGPGHVPPTFDVQDCVGAYSLKPDQWPDLYYDSVKVRTSFRWTFGPYNLFRPNLPWLPEIDWSEAGLGAEVMYLYRSWYGLQGKSHPLGIQISPSGPFDYNMEGAPCGHRYNAGLFKTVHFNFTPMALDNSFHADGSKPDSAAFELVKYVMDFLYDPTASAGNVSDGRYSGSTAPLSASDERASYWRRMDVKTLEKGNAISKEASENIYRNMR